MCRSCYVDTYGAPTDLPDNAETIIEQINDLYAQPDGGTGGPLHVALDDMNLDDDCWEPYTEHDWLPRTMELAKQISRRMKVLSVDQRAAVIAKWEGWL